MNIAMSSIRGAFRVALVLLGLGLVTAQAQAAEAGLRSLEDAIETMTDSVLLPTSSSGTLTLRECPEPCAMKSLSLTDQSRFFVGSSQVSLADFNAFINRKGPQFLMVFHVPGEPTITRLMVFGKL